MAKVCAGCGLTTDADGNLIVQVDAPAWPFTCSASAGGGQLYCDASSGRLHGPPNIEAQVDVFSANTTVANLPVPNTPTTIATTNVVSSAPGSCGQVVLRHIEIEFQVDLIIPAHGRVRGYIQGDEMFDIPNTSNAPLNVHSTQVTKVLFDLRTAGQVTGQATFQLDESGTLGATYSRVQWFHRTSYITTHTP